MIRITRWLVFDECNESAPRGHKPAGARQSEDRPKAIRINRTTDTRIFSLDVEARWLYFSVGYRDAGCLNCTIVHNDAQLIHAKLTRAPMSGKPQ